MSSTSANFVRVHLDARAHRGSDHTGTDILALRSSRLRLDDGTDECIEVLFQLLSAEGDLTNDAVDDVGLIEAVFDLTGLCVCRFRG